jgi:hypothetical protein
MIRRKAYGRRRGPIQNNACGPEQEGRRKNIFKKMLDLFNFWSYGGTPLSAWLPWRPAEKEQKVGRDILKRKEDVNRRIIYRGVNSFRHSGDPTFGKFMKGGSDHVGR